MITPVVLSGGSGTRLWPISRAAYPKQLLPIGQSGLSLLQETVHRVSDPARFAPPILVCNHEHRFLVAEQLRQIQVVPQEIVLEPAGRNTAPAVAVAALIQRATDPDGVLLVLPSDHAIANAGAFAEAIGTAAEAALGGALVTFGIKARRPETGYGYIRRGRPLNGTRGAFEVASFVEKPRRQAAEVYVTDGGYYWNSGMFLFTAAAVLDELGRHAPDLLAGCERSIAEAGRDLDFLRIGAAAFESVEAISLDYAVMEKTGRAAVVPCDIGWNDIGSWAAMWEIGGKDENQNVVVGDVVLQDVSRSLVRSEGDRLIAAVGLEDMIVIATDDAVLIVPMERAQDVKDVVETLKAGGRTEPVLHTKVYRPWGFYQGIHSGDRFQVKRLTLNIGERLSLQMHHHRSEHWIVVNGTAKVTRGDETFLLHENESAHIPANTVHRLENPGRVPLNVIEVQSGGYLGEDDIVRLEDVYGRS